MVLQPVVRQVVYTTRGRICECVHTITVLLQYWRLDIPAIRIVTCATREPAHNNG